MKVKLPPDLLARLAALDTQAGGYWFWNRLGGESKHQTATGNMRRYLRPIYRRSGVVIRDKRGSRISMLDPKTGLARHGSDGKALYAMVHSHQWRHTFVHRLLKQNAPIEAIATLIGDTVKVVSQTYAHFIEERQAQLDKHAEAAWGLAS